MTKKRTIALHLHGMPYDNLITLANRIHNGFADNAGVYPSPPVSLIDQQAAIDALILANIDAGMKGKRGSMLDRLIRNDAGDVVRENLKKLAAYCMIVAPNDVASWAEVGFAAKQPREKAPATGTVRNLRQVIKNNIPDNGILMKWVKPLDTIRRRTIVYNVMRSETNDLSDAALIATITKTSFTDIVEKTGVFYYYWVIAVNTNGEGSACTPYPAAAKLTWSAM